MTGPAYGRRDRFRARSPAGRRPGSTGGLTLTVREAARIAP